MNDPQLADTKIQTRGLRVEIDHQTHYRFEGPMHHGVQRLRLQPCSDSTQSVVNWDLTIENGDVQVEYIDHLGNAITLIRIKENAPHVSVRAKGVVETHEHFGILGDQIGGVPLFFYTQPTNYTEVGPSMAKLVSPLIGIDDRLTQLHDLSGVIADKVEYQTGRTTAATTAEEAATLGRGVCQDHAHMFVGLAHWIGVPARYVSGYLVVEDGSSHPASHAWAEAWVDDLGWVGFDVSNQVATDKKYVRLAVGRDYREAAPISGIVYGEGSGELDVSLNVHGYEQ